jgi:hypothetical protein
MRLRAVPCYDRELHMTWHADCSAAGRAVNWSRLDAASLNAGKPPIRGGLTQVNPRGH